MIGRRRVSGDLYEFVDLLNNAVDVIRVFKIPEPQNRILHILQHHCALGISHRCISMLRTIKLNNQANLFTTKICDVATNRMLPAKLQTINLPITQNRPQF
jgi:hypothetical protein